MGDDYTRDLLTGKVPYSDMVEAVKQAKAQATAEEREACAKLAEDHIPNQDECATAAQDHIAAAIRARGKDGV